MMSNNKILTVSYGTFSCTLEGFDDSFGTMKAITEYFRDLASDDRYFGAEPVQPDAQMLASIAQKEISRRVEAREHEGNIVLSAAQDDVAPAQLAGTAAAVAPSVVAEAIQDTADLSYDADIEKAPSVDEGAIAAALEQDTPADPAPEAPEPAPVSQEADEIGTQIGAPANEDYIDGEEITADPSIAVLRRAQATAVDTEISDVDIVPDRDDAEVSSFFAQSEAVAEVEDDIQPAPQYIAEAQEDAAEPLLSQVEAAPIASVAPSAAPKSESIADKLQRIREVVAQNGSEEDDAEAEQDFEASEALAQDQDASDTGKSDDDTILSALRDIKGAIATDDAAEEEQIQEHPAQSAEEDTDLSGILETLKQNPSEDAQDRAEAETEEVSQAAIAEPEITTEDTSAQEETRQPDTAAEEEPAPRARVIKVKRVDLQAAIDKGVIEEDSPVAQSAPDVAQSSLSEAEEAELAQELAELEADLDFDAVEEDEAISVALASAEDAAEEPAQEVASAAREMLPPIDEGQNPDMNRLMEETDQQMSEPENTTRRNAFAHLRAAVAAKKADVAMGGHKDEEAEGDAYREDLAEVVRPRRPVSGEQRTPRPSSARPAPLKLVAEQRIDTETTAEATPVRPRRVAAVQEEEGNQAEESFAEFAAEAGATSLPDLLEAAAAYMSFVEGRAQFSRPQLMNKVRQVEQNGFTREDSLRLFGKLLRDGKIEKTNAGRFQVSDQIGFRPDARAAG